MLKVYNRLNEISTKSLINIVKSKVSTRPYEANIELGKIIE